MGSRHFKSFTCTTYRRVSHEFRGHTRRYVMLVTDRPCPVNQPGKPFTRIMGNNGTTHEQWINTALQDYEERLLRYAHRIIGDQSRAEDVVQETFLKLCKQNSAELNGRLAQWLYTVCRNRALDVKRKESRMAVVSEIIEQNTVSSSQTASPTHNAELIDENSRVLCELSQLKENQQECLRLKFHDGLSYREIGEIMNLSASNVGFLIHTGLKTLRQRLSRDD